MTNWAKHFRNHYCLDKNIDNLILGTSLSRAEYLKTLKFPDSSNRPGPSIRAGDFAEILLADYLEFRLNYWVPRTKYSKKPTRNESVRGTDIIGFHFLTNGKNSPKDALICFEVKTQFKSRQNHSRLQDAVDDSIQDERRKGEYLNAQKQWFLSENNNNDADRISRFQSRVDYPYLEYFGAAAMISSDLFNPQLISSTTIKDHPYSKNIKLIVIRSENFMSLVHELYRRAADEA
jgi:hypothetical protein